MGQSERSGFAGWVAANRRLFRSVTHVNFAQQFGHWRRSFGDLKPDGPLFPLMGARRRLVWGGFQMGSCRMMICKC